MSKILNYCSQLRSTLHDTCLTIETFARNNNADALHNNNSRRLRTNGAHDSRGLVNVFDRQNRSPPPNGHPTSQYPIATDVAFSIICCFGISCIG